MKTLRGVVAMVCMVVAGGVYAADGCGPEPLRTDYPPIPAGDTAFNAAHAAWAECIRLSTLGGNGNQTPEPGSIALIALAGGALALASRRKKKA